MRSQMYFLRRAGIIAALFAAIVFLLSFLPRVLNPTPPNAEQRLRDSRWIDSSPYWLDRQACRWLTLCGLHHVRWDPPALPDDQASPAENSEWTGLRRRSLPESGAVPAWESVNPRTRRRTSKGGGSQELDSVPEYVLKYAPLVHLSSREHFWPADIAEHVKHMNAHVNGSLLNSTMSFGLGNLDLLNDQLLPVYLTSEEDVEKRPEWLYSGIGAPAPFDEGGEDADTGDDDDLRAEPPASSPPSGGTTWWDVDKAHPVRRISDPRLKGRRSSTEGTQASPRPRGISDLQVPMHKPDDDGYSKAPAVLILVDKGSGILDAFWFFFYSYNLGQTVLGVRYGNHIGDWEHCMVRFEDGIPRALFMSEHEGGQAYAWSALEKYRQGSNESGTGRAAERPVIYSAVGSHAMYATPGNHAYVLPFGMLKDVTDRGPIWDPAKNLYAYHYDYEAGRAAGGSGLTPTSSNPAAPTSWFHYAGAWGDELYNLSDARQWRLFGQYHYVTGPQGPKFKRLDRRKVCQTDRCRMLYSIAAGKKASWYH